MRRRSTVPELPEVEVVRRGAQQWVIGRTIAAIDVLHPRAIRRHVGGAADFGARLAGARVLSVDRRGKYMWLAMDSGDLLVVHLGMSGQLRVQPADVADEAHLRVRLAFTDHGPQLRFLDQRTFGGMFVDIAGTDQQVPTTIAHIARDPFDPLFDAGQVARVIRMRSSPIKAALLDQTVVSGIGNIYADEALWRAKLNWARPANTIPVARVRMLLSHASDVMSEALSEGGTSFDSLYVNVNGASGYFGRRLAAYGQLGQPCPRCGSQIIREKFANRSSFRCPRCQP